MRLKLLAVAALSAALAAPACGRSSGGPYPSASQLPRFRVMAGEPGCAYQVIETLRMTNPYTGNDVVTRARALGAHALANYRYDPVRREQEGTAVRFSNPSNPDCYR